LNRAPLYEFGYGLSYTTFKYDDVVANPVSLPSNADNTIIQLSMLITNTGYKAGKEVVQVR
jgi:beta-glucosidase